jgi:hypothetical protein
MVLFGPKYCSLVGVLAFLCVSCFGKHVGMEHQLASLESDLFSLEEVDLKEDYAYKILFYKNDGAWTTITDAVCGAWAEFVVGVDTVFRGICSLPQQQPKLPLEKCIDEYRAIRGMAVGGKILRVVTLGLFGHDGPMGEIVKQIDRATSSAPSTEGVLSTVAEAATSIACSIGDTAINVALLGIPGMVDAGSEVVVAAAEDIERVCLACHLAYLVHRWIKEHPDSFPPIDDVIEFEGSLLPTDGCERITLKNRVRLSKAWIVLALTEIQKLSSPLAGILPKFSYTGSRFLRAAKAIGPVMVKNLSSPKIWG